MKTKLLKTIPSVLRTSLLVALMLTQQTDTIAQRLQQPAGRSVVAVNRTGGRSVTATGGQGNLISWRKLAQEPEGTTYNVYRRTAGTADYVRLNDKPLSATCYVPQSLTVNTEYAVAAVSPAGVEGALSSPFLYRRQSWPNVWFSFSFDDTVIPRNDYRTKFVWPMDLDGDGEVDAVVCDRLFAGAGADDDAEDRRDNDAATSHKLQAYRLTGELLWTIDMGPNMNICGGQNDMVVAYDINCDGRCEVIIKSCDGTRFWDKQHETWGLYAMHSETADTDGDGITDYRQQTVRNRPFYVSVVDGETGAEIACSELDYSQVHDGVDRYTRDNRADYMSDGYAAMDGHFAVCYLDGVHPSLVMECLDRTTDKTHHNYVFTWDYDWTATGPVRWHHSATWSRNDKTPWPAEFHQLRVADVDGDGRDEMVQGGYSVNPLTGWFASPGIGHGDRFVLSDIDPDRPGLEVYAIQQSALLGQLLYDARTAERIKEWYLPSVFDVGRGACMDVDATHKGYELYSFTDDYVYDCHGEKTAYTRSGCGIKTMFEGLWWNGDLQREELSSSGGSGWGTNMMVTQVLDKARLAEFSQESSWAAHGGTGTRPAFMGDIVGDWREEVILVCQNDDECTGLVGYTTNMPTTHNIYALQQDPHYRGDCTTRGYYQHPNTGFYLGGDMPLPPLPPVFTSDLRWRGGSSVADGFVSFDLTQARGYADGQSLMFDVSGDNGDTIRVTRPLSATTLYLMNPRGHDYTFSHRDWNRTDDDAVTTGAGNMVKSMAGTATVCGSLMHTGGTIVSEGTLLVNGSVAGPVELRARGTLAGNLLLKDTITFEGALNYEGCRLMPRDGDTQNGVIASACSMTLPGNVYLEVGAKPDAAQQALSGLGWADHLSVKGDLVFQGTNYLTVNLVSPEPATYLIAQCSGTLTCDPSALKTRGLEGINYDLVVDGNRLLLIINSTREATTGVLWTGAESPLWDYKSLNFSVGGDAVADPSPATATAFVAGDAVVFTSAAQQTTVTLNELMTTSGVNFQSGRYILQGDGGISGAGDVIIGPDADVTLNMKYSDYTGRTIVNGGRLTVPNFYDGGQRSAIGAAASEAGNLQLNGGSLVLSRDNMGTDRPVTISDTATITVAQSSSALSLKGQVSGAGYLVKDGAGQLNFNYGGVNDFAGVIVRQGVVAQGAWNSTFGRNGSPMLLAGGEVHQIDVNSTSTVPVLNHQFTVQEGTDNRIVGSSRGKINGSFAGRGNLTITTRYVRCDIGASFKDFEGQLTLKGEGGNVRLMQGVTDMAKTRLVVDAATYVAHNASGGSSEVAATTRVGSLSATAADAVLGGAKSTWTVGCLDENSTFSGLLQASRVNKVGAGKLTLTTPGHTASIYVEGGTLELRNSTQNVFTSAAITVRQGARLAGTALAGDVTVERGGILKGGLASSATGTLRISGTLALQGGATLMVQLGKTSGNTQIGPKGAVSFGGDTILVVIPAGRTLTVGDELTVLKTGFTTATGDFIIKCEAEDGSTYEFDTSTLLTDGKLRVTAVTAGIAAIPADDAAVDVHTVDGRRLRTAVPFRHALDGLPGGVYIVGGMKVTKR